MAYTIAAVEVRYTPNPSSILVARVAAGPTADDTNLINFLTNKGHTVTHVADTSALPDTGYDVCIVTDSGSSGSNAILSIDTCLLPVMMFETSVDTAMLAYGAMTATGSGTTWDLQGDPFGLNAGFPDPLTVFASASSYYGVTSGLPAADGFILAIAPSTTHTVAWGIADGHFDASDTNAVPNRRIAMRLITSRLSGMVAGANSGLWFNGIVEWLAGVAAPNGGAVSGAVGWVGSVTGQAPPPAVPTGLTATPVSSSQIDLNWDDMAGASGYDIERDGVIIVSDHPTSSYSDTGRTPSTEYDYRVRQVTA